LSTVSTAGVTRQATSVILLNNRRRRRKGASAGMKRGNAWRHVGLTVSPASDGTTPSGGRRVSEKPGGCGGMKKRTPARTGDSASRMNNGIIHRAWRGATASLYIAHAAVVPAAQRQIGVSVGPYRITLRRQARIALRCARTAQNLSNNRRSAINSMLNISNGGQSGRWQQWRDEKHQHQLLSTGGYNIRQRMRGSDGMGAGVGRWRRRSYSIMATSSRHQQKIISTRMRGRQHRRAGASAWHIEIIIMAAASADARAAYQHAVSRRVLSTRWGRARIDNNGKLEHQQTASAATSIRVAAITTLLLCAARAAPRRAVNSGTSSRSAQAMVRLRCARQSRARAT